MQYSSAILLAAFAVTNVLGHGVITSIQGANGVTMPGLSGRSTSNPLTIKTNTLSVIDGTPRDCASPACGSEADTSIIRKRELGTAKASALGRTEGGGPVDAATMIAAFMDGAAGNTTAAKTAREIHEAALERRALGGLLGGKGKGAAAGAGGGTKTPKGTVETGVKAATGAGATSGLPTCSDTGVVSMTFHQVNQDGAGPLTAAIDPTSGGTDPAAFKSAQVVQNVPGSGVGGLSLVTTTDFPVTIQMPAGMTCNGQVGGVSNVCIARLQNSALAGPFGGSVAFTQSPAAKKRAIEYNMRKMRFARALAAIRDLEELDVDEALEARKEADDEE